ncbi:MAG: FecR domain-containing protein [Rikenellaceae bacterium]|nr:FecR domain-containing protein [Rikenellaceae bacterium]
MTPERKNIESLLTDYFRGDLSPLEESVVEQWIEKNTAHKKSAGEASKLNFLCESLFMDRTTDSRGAYKKVSSRIRTAAVHRALTRLQKFAAVVAIPLVAASIYLFSSLQHQQNTVIEVRANTGMVSEVTLPDNTTVWLNSNSSLKYPARFGQGKRMVELSGEAFFDVAEDAKKKFIVQARTAQVEVYGTEFNIEAYPDSQEIHTTLVSGSVGFRYENSVNQKVITHMEPNQQLSYNSATGSLSLRYVDTAFNTAWKEGKVVLDDTPLADALRVIGNKYNVAFVIRNDSLRENTFTGTFSYQTLDMILHHFTLSSDICFRKTPPENRAEIYGREIIEVN